MQQPKSLGRYRILHPLGQGGMAHVFLAVASGPAGFQKLTVLKVLRDDLSADGDFARMFLDEARLAARLNHPHVVQTFEVGEESGQRFIAMEYLVGQPLNRIVKRAAGEPSVLPPAARLRVVSDVLTALHYAHELRDFDGQPLGVVHRDVSPHNVFVTYDGITKLVDFGIAKATTRSSETQTGMVKGKLRYMPPEQARSEPVDRRADIFAVGTMLWELMTGLRMWDGLDDVQILMRLASGDMPQLVVPPGMPPSLVDICARALSPLPDDRYATAAEMQADVDALLEESGERVTTAAMGKSLADAFAEDRERTEDSVRRELRALENGNAPLDVPTGGERTSQPALDATRVTLGGASHATPARRPSTRRWATAALVGAVVVVAGGSALLVTPKAPSPPTTGAAAARPAGDTSSDLETRPPRQEASATPAAPSSPQATDAAAKTSTPRIPALAAPPATPTGKAAEPPAKTRPTMPAAPPPTTTANPAFL